MKRITPHIKLLDLIATLIDIVYIIGALLLVSYFFSILVEPHVITDIVDTTYQILGLTITSAQLNTGISLLIGYLVVFVPTTFSNLKRIRSKDVIEMDEWTYRTQFLYMAMSFFTLNPFSAVIRYLDGFEIKRVVAGYGFVKTVQIAVQQAKDLLSGKTYATWKAKRDARKHLAASQQNLERVSKRDFFTKMVGMVGNYTLLTFVALFILVIFSRRW